MAIRKTRQRQAGKGSSRRELKFTVKVTKIETFIDLNNVKFV